MTSRIAAIALIVLGVLGLAYGGFGITRERTAAEIGPVQIEVEEREWVNIPAWLGGAALLAGGVLLFVGTRKS
jgi:hypothetical protein